MIPLKYRWAEEWAYLKRGWIRFSVPPFFGRDIYQERWWKAVVAWFREFWRWL